MYINICTRRMPSNQKERRNKKKHAKEPDENQVDKALVGVNHQADLFILY